MVETQNESITEDDTQVGKLAEDAEYILSTQPGEDEFIIEDDLMVGEVDSTKVDHQSLLFTLNHIQNCVSHIQQNLNNIKVAAKQNVKRHTFGNNSAKTKLDQETIEKINENLKISKTKEKISLDHALVLLKHMYSLKLENLSLKNQNKEMKALLKSNDIEIPGNAIKEPEMTPIDPKEDQPESKGEN